MGSVVTALVIAFVGGAAMVRFGPALGFVDLPDGYLKSHDRPAVPLGGVGLFLGVHVAMLAEGQFNTGLLIASSTVFIVGLIDDKVSLSPGTRLVAEVTAGFLLVVFGDIPALPGGMVGIGIGVLLVVVTINAVNLFDGLDGLAGSSGFVAALGIAVLAASRGLDPEFGLILAGALAGFLIWNWQPAKLFLGDNGAYTLAIFLVYGMMTAAPSGSETDVLVAAGLLGVFAVDLVVTLLRRRLAGRPLFVGDRSHVYDQLRDRGLSVSQVAIRMAGAQAVLVIVVVIVDSQTSAPVALATLAVLFALVLFGLARMGFLTTDGEL